VRTILILLAISLTMVTAAQVHLDRNDLGGPDPNRSVAAGTLSALEAEGIIESAKTATVQTWMRQLASQKFGKSRIRRVYLIIFSLRDGQKVQAVAESDESPVPEQSGLVVYVVSKVLQPDGKPVPPRQ